MVQPIDIACVEQGHDLLHLGKIVIARRTLLSALQERHARKRQCKHDDGRGQAADDIGQESFLLWFLGFGTELLRSHGGLVGFHRSSFTADTPPKRGAASY